MGMIHWLGSDGSELCETGNEAPPRERLQRFVEGDLEYCWVLYKGRRTCMIVNETGAMKTDSREPLPLNVNASRIYAAASARGDDYHASHPMRIHGNAVVLENIRVD